MNGKNILSKNVKWEFIQMSGSGRVPIPAGVIEVRFFYNSSAALDVALINQTYGMSAYNQFTAGVTIRNPYELILINNSNEFDVTVYDLKLTAGSLMTIAYKYYQSNQ